jgi:hypothetical protein
MTIDEGYKQYLAKIHQQRVQEHSQQVTSSTSHLLDRTWTRSATSGKRSDGDWSVVRASK